MRIFFFMQLSLLLGLLCISNFAYSQVTIGSAIPPNRGALLDLKEFEPKINNENSTKGLMLPRVSLKDISSLEGIEGAEFAAKDLYTGLIVYNVLDNAICGLGVGLYVWDGNKWESLDRTRVPVVKGSYAQDVAILKKIMDDNPDSTLDWVIDSSNPNDMKFISGTGVEFYEVCGEQRLKFLSVQSMQLSTLDLRGASELFSLSSSFNKLTSLHVSGLQKMNQILCSSNNLESLDLSGLVNLEHLNCSSNKLKTLDFADSNLLKNLNCGYNKLESLDISNLKELEYFYGFSTNLKALDLSGLKNIKTLFISSRYLSDGSVTICKSVYDSSRLDPAKGNAIYSVVECD